MKEIPLTKNQLAIVDNEDFESLTQYKWYALYDEEAHTWYAYCHIGKGNNRIIRGMHVLIMNPINGKLIDHRDRNGLHNYRSNLRPCTRSQNKANSAVHVNSVSGFKGVSLDSRYGIWQAKIKVNQKAIWLGEYKTPLEAAVVYDTAALKYFGEFALTNKMMGLL